jgi:hypothetical protein
MVRTGSQLRLSALTLLRNAYAQGLTDAAALDFAVAAMGAEYRALIEGVWAKHFRLMGPT